MQDEVSGSHQDSPDKNQNFSAKKEQKNAVSMATKKKIN